MRNVTTLPLSSRPEESWAKGPPKAMKNGSCSATTAAGSAALPFVISTGAQRSGEIRGVSGPSLGRRSQGDETGPVQQLLLLEAPPSPLSSRPEESWAFGPPKAMKSGSCSATTVAGSAALPSVISTGRVMGLRPTQGDETGPVQQLLLLEAPSPLSSRPERSVVERSAVSAALP